MSTAGGVPSGALSVAKGVPRLPRSEYAVLAADVRAAGLLRRRPGWYVIKITALGTACLAIGVTFAVLGNSWWQLGVAATAAVWCAQASFLSHDASHGQAFGSLRANAWTALIHGNLLLGISYAWWVHDHNRHHRDPNHAERDPNVAEFILASTPAIAASRTGVRRLLAAHQAWLYLPLSLLEGLNLRYVSVRALTDPAVRFRVVSRPVEAAGLFVHGSAYVAALLWVLPPGKAAVFFAVHQGLWGLYMSLAFAPNHKGMPVVYDADGLDWLRRQVITARDLKGGRLTEFIFGGLNFQIEHHLFPAMPRPALRRAAPIVREFCRERDIPYTCESVPMMYIRVFRHLHQAGAPARAQRKTRAAWS